MSIGTVSSGIFEDLGSPTEISVAYISGWFTRNVGKLNNQIFENFSGVDELENEEWDIFSALFLENYYRRCATSSTNAAGFDVVLEIEDDGSRVRKANRNELSKTFIQLIKDNKVSLDMLTGKYLSSKASVAEVTDPFYQVTTTGPETTEIS